MKIIDIVKFNHRHAFVLDGDFSLTYEKHGDLLIGSDETQSFFDVLRYAPCGGDPTFGGNYAFGGRKFDLQMKDGSVTHCFGQYWSGGCAEAEKILGIESVDFTHAPIDRLRKRFVFFDGTADKAKLQAMIDAFQAAFPDYTLWDYREYEDHVKKGEDGYD